MHSSFCFSSNVKGRFFSSFYLQKVTIVKINTSIRREWEKDIEKFFWSIFTFLSKQFDIVVDRIIEFRVGPWRPYALAFLVRFELSAREHQRWPKLLGMVPEDLGFGMGRLELSLGFDYLQLVDSLAGDDSWIRSPSWLMPKRGYMSQFSQTFFFSKLLYVM